MYFFIQYFTKYCASTMKKTIMNGFENVFPDIIRTMAIAMFSH